MNVKLKSCININKLLCYQSSIILNMYIHHKQPVVQHFWIKKIKPSNMNVWDTAAV